MARLTNPTLPDAVIDTDDERAAVLRKSGWVDADGEPEVTGTEIVVESGTSDYVDPYDLPLNH